MEKIDFNKIYEKEHNNVFYFILSRIRNKEIAEELANNVFVKFYGVLRKDMFDSKQSSVKTYLYNISKNIVIDYYRTKKEITPNIEDYTNDEGEQTLYAVSNEMADKDIERKEFEERINVIMKNLSLKEKRLFVMRFIRHYPIKDIAKKLNMNINTVKVTIKRLKEKLAPEYEYIVG